MVATVEFLAEEQIAEVRSRAETLPRGRRRALAVARMLLNLYAGPKFRAALHLWVAASTDEALRSVLAPLEARVGRDRTGSRWNCWAWTSPDPACGRPYRPRSIWHAGSDWPSAQ